MLNFDSRHGVILSLSEKYLIVIFGFSVWVCNWFISLVRIWLLFCLVDENS